MRNSHNITITESDTFAADDETTWSLPGAVVGFIAWLLALGFPCLMYGPNTLFFFIYTCTDFGLQYLIQFFRLFRSHLSVNFLFLLFLH